MILESACHAPPRDFRAKQQQARATSRLADFLCQIRKHHPTYKEFCKGTPLGELGYYGT